MLLERLNKYNPGDIIQLKFGTFKERPGNKLVSTSHMFLVVDELNVCIVSSQMDKVNNKYPYNIPIQDWEEAHLNKPSHAKLDSYGEISDDNVFKKVGQLTDRDRENILSKFKDAPQHYLLEWISDSCNL